MRAASVVFCFLAAIARIEPTFAVPDSYTTDTSDDDTIEDPDEDPEDWIDDVSMRFSPTSGQAMPTESFVVEWAYDGYLTGAATIEVWLDDDDDDQNYGTSSTTVDWSESTITLPTTFLPRVDPGSTSSLWLWVYTITSGDGDYVSDYYSVYPDVSLYASATPTSMTTITHTDTTTITRTRTTPTADTSTPAPPPVSNTNDPESEGLSTGGKAGIGVGVSAGAILVAAGAFLFFRRRKRQEPKTIREIPSASATNLAGPGPMTAWKPANTSSSGNSYEMS